MLELKELIRFAENDFDGMGNVKASSLLITLMSWASDLKNL